ncbi:MLO-like protein [Actinidia chinensis var. chinensis]|uniref:MLO-like protein n=1 Tax=Actinidia chinensis var. chinensis TaxID=1590841 RepID=A0A2R6PYV1_ACTCC|nr:MLO-like protein [Actinidia chinensis var. chinensis]
MAGGKEERTLEETSTWAVAVVCFVMVGVSIVIEHLIHLVGSWLRKRHKRALYEALEKIKAELMLLGFISLLLTVVQDHIAEICVPKKVGNSWHPCHKNSDKKYEDKCEKKGMVQFVSAYGVHQLHIFIFVLAVSHVLYCIITLGLGTLKMRRWKAWEDVTRTIEYQYHNDPQRFRFARETSFGRRHLNFWSRSTILLWIVCFFRQFFTSVTKVDYLTLRHGFVIAHLAPESQVKFNFQKYIRRSLEEDFKVVVGISPIIWLFAVLFLLTNTYGWFSYLWLPFIPLIILLVVGAKLQMIITKMGLRIQERGDVLKGAPVVQPGDDLFWCKRPRLILFLIHFVLFTNAFQLAFFMWSWYAFGLRSCFHKRLEDIIIRLSMGFIIQVLCSYVTLPLYALVTQMGSSMKPTIFGDQVTLALRNWHRTAKKQVKHIRHSEHTTPFSSRPGTPVHGMSPVHLLRGYKTNDIDSLQPSPRASNIDNDGWDRPEWARSPHRRGNDDYDDVEPKIREPPPPPQVGSTATGAGGGPFEVQINLSDFTFNKS